MQIMKRSDFHKGSGGRGWVGTVEYFLRPDSVAKLMELKQRTQPRASRIRIVPPTKTPQERNQELLAEHKRLCNELPDEPLPNDVEFGAVPY